MSGVGVPALQRDRRRDRERWQQRAVGPSVAPCDGGHREHDQPADDEVRPAGVRPGYAELAMRVRDRDEEHDERQPTKDQSLAPRRRQPLRPHLREDAAGNVHRRDAGEDGGAGGERDEAVSAVRIGVDEHEWRQRGHASERPAGRREAGVEVAPASLGGHDRGCHDERGIGIPVRLEPKRPQRCDRGERDADGGCDGGQHLATLVAEVGEPGREQCVGGGEGAPVECVVGKHDVREEQRQGRDHGEVNERGRSQPSGSRQRDDCDGCEGHPPRAEPLARDVEREEEGSPRDVDRERGRHGIETPEPLPEEHAVEQHAVRGAAEPHSARRDVAVRQHLGVDEHKVQRREERADGEEDRSRFLHTRPAADEQAGAEEPHRVRRQQSDAPAGRQLAVLERDKGQRRHHEQERAEVEQDVGLARRHPGLQVEGWPGWSTQRRWSPPRRSRRRRCWRRAGGWRAGDGGWRWCRRRGLRSRFAGRWSGLATTEARQATLVLLAHLLGALGVDQLDVDPSLQRRE